MKRIHAPEIAEGRTEISFISKDVIHEILSRLPLYKILQVQSMYGLWHRIAISSGRFRNRWDARNEDKWIVAHQSDGVAIFNTQQGQWFKRNFQDEWRNSCWRVAAGAGGLIVYINRNDGFIKMLNPLTMNSYELPDPVIHHGSGVCLSSYLKKKTGAAHKEEEEESVVFELMFDSSQANSYDLIVFGNLIDTEVGGGGGGDDFFESKTFFLMYKSVQRSWEISFPRGRLHVKRRQLKIVLKNRIFFFPHPDQDRSLFNWVWVTHCKLPAQNQDCADSGIIYRLTHGAFKGLHGKICYGVVEYKDRFMMVGSGACGRDGPYLKMLLIYELVYHATEWKLVFQIEVDKFYENASLPRIRREHFAVTCVGDGDWIWIIPAVSEKMASIDIDEKTSKLWPNSSSQSLQAFSMPLRLSSPMDFS